MGVPIGSAMQMHQVAATPSGSPPGGDLLLYAKNDGRLYTKDSSGAEKIVSGDIVCTSTTRPIPSAGTPMVGARIYETDTYVERVWDGSQWRAVGWETFLFNESTTSVQNLTSGTSARTGWASSAPGAENNGWSGLGAGAFQVPADGIYQISGIISAQGMVAANNNRFGLIVNSGHSNTTPASDGSVGSTYFQNGVAMGNRYTGLNWSFAQRCAAGDWWQICFSAAGPDQLSTVGTYSYNSWTMIRVGV